MCCVTRVTQPSVMICCWNLGTETPMLWDFAIKNLPWNVVQCLKNCPSCTEPVVSWPCSQNPVIWLYTKRFESSPFFKLFSCGMRFKQRRLLSPYTRFRKITGSVLCNGIANKNEVSRSFPQSSHKMVGQCSDRFLHTVKSYQRRTV